MFAPRPEIAVTEMRRVLKSGGSNTFATWPPEHFVGRMFALISRHSPPPPSGTAPSPQWRNQRSSLIITERLAASFEAPIFARGTMGFPALSVEHCRLFMEKSAGPIQKLVERLAGDPEKLSAIRGEFDALVRPYYAENVVHHDYILTRARAR
jgi:hypothetical protein